MTDQVQGYTFEYAYSNAIIKAFSTQVQPAYPIEYNSNNETLYIQNIDSLANNTGSDNLAIGYKALESNVEGFDNLAIGHAALESNTEGYQNIAIGTYALLNNTGSDNLAICQAALLHNTTGIINIAIGIATLGYNTTGSYNTALGYQALENNTTGSYNIALGYQALENNTTENNNIWIGNYATNGNIYPLNNGSYGNNELFIAPNIGLIGGVDNNTYDTTSSTIVPSTSSYVIIYGELATSFGGTAPTSITAGASPYTLTPSSTTNQIVIISGGSVSSVELNGTTTGLTSGSFYCRAGDSLTITYTTAPTILQYNM